MRQDQYEKLQKLSERIADRAIIDVDPDNWVGQGKPASQMEKGERGDAYWCRRMAGSTIGLLTRVMMLTDVMQRASNKGVGAGAVLDEEDENDKLIANAEKQAEDLMQQLARRNAMRSDAAK